MLHRPPGGDSDANTFFLENLQSCLDKINIAKPDSLVILIGDFNAHYDPSNIIESSVFGNLLYRWMGWNVIIYFKYLMNRQELFKMMLLS